MWHNYAPKWSGTSPEGIWAGTFALTLQKRCHVLCYDCLIESNCQKAGYAMNKAKFPGIMSLQSCLAVLLWHTYLLSVIPIQKLQGCHKVVTRLLQPCLQGTTINNLFTTLSVHWHCSHKVVTTLSVHCNHSGMVVTSLSVHCYLQAMLYQLCRFDIPVYHHKN